MSAEKPAAEKKKKEKNLSPEKKDMKRGAVRFKSSASPEHLGSGSRKKRKQQRPGELPPLPLPIRINAGVRRQHHPLGSSSLGYSGARAHPRRRYSITINSRPDDETSRRVDQSLPPRLFSCVFVRFLPVAYFLFFERPPSTLVFEYFMAPRGYRYAEFSNF